MGKPEGGLLVFAGLRGVVTLAAAQSLPHSFPHRSFVVMLAFFVATGSLLLQGGTLPWFMRRLGLVGLDDNSDEAHVIHHLVEDAARDFLTDPDLLRPDGTPYDPEVLARVRRRTVPDVPDEEFDSPEELARATGFRELYSRTLSAQRNALLDLREVGSFDSRALEAALTSVDAEQISLELKPGEWLTSAD
jgi:CPA1 family monovalent cation:H+ antiporter